MPEPDRPDWPRPGVLGYLVGDTGDGDAAEITLESEESSSTVFLMEDSNGNLFYVYANPGILTDNRGLPLVHIFPFSATAVKQTLAESLRESAREETKYGTECLARAAALERVAAESEAKRGLAGRDDNDAR